MVEKLLNEILSEIKGIKQEMTEFKQEITEFKQEMTRFTEQTNERFERIEQKMATKQDIEAIFAEQQKDVLGVLHVIKNQITEQAQSTNNRLDRISMDVNYLVGKTAEHENDILSLKRASQL